VKRRWCRWFGHRWSVQLTRGGRVCLRCHRYEVPVKQMFDRIEISGPRVIRDPDVPPGQAYLIDERFMWSDPVDVSSKHLSRLDLERAVDRAREIDDS
jgi:hypothetical protein